MWLEDDGPLEMDVSDAFGQELARKVEFGISVCIDVVSNRLFLSLGNQVAVLTQDWCFLGRITLPCSWNRGCIRFSSPKQELVYVDGCVLDAVSLLDTKRRRIFLPDAERWLNADRFDIDQSNGNIAAKFPLDDTIRLLDVNGKLLKKTRTAASDIHCLGHGRGYLCRHHQWNHIYDADLKFVSKFRSDGPICGYDEPTASLFCCAASNQMHQLALDGTCKAQYYVNNNCGSVGRFSNGILSFFGARIRSFLRIDAIPIRPRPTRHVCLF